MLPPLTLSGLYSFGGTGGVPAAGGMAAMGPIGWSLLGLSALGTLGGLLGRKQNTTQFLDPINVGEKPTMNITNPYDSPMMAIGQDPYGRLSNPLIRRPATFSSTLGRYGGFR